VSRRLLVISCSAKKRKSRGEISAWDLYDGMVFRVLKKLQRESEFSHDIDIVIISAKYGLLLPKQKVKWYDLRMNASLAQSQRRAVVNRLRKLIRHKVYGEVCINLGKDYLPAIGDPKLWKPRRAKLTFIDGEIGRRLHQIKKWATTKRFSSTK
jgi:cytoplasmic iron level regulating protein YaaA (DUF328/UPF0246 family)